MRENGDDVSSAGLFLTLAMDAAQYLPETKGLSRRPNAEATINPAFAGE